MINYYNYYLVALNLENGEMKPRIINIDTSTLNGEDVKELSNIAHIDSVTSQYDESFFRKYLQKKEIINNIYTPIFITRISKSYVSEAGKKKTKTSVKYYCPIFKSESSKLINNISLTTLRQRSLTLDDTYYLLNHFKDLYLHNGEYREIVEYIINDHDIKHLLNYKSYIDDPRSNPIKYNLLREVVSSFYEYEKCKNYENFIHGIYGREIYTNEILKVLPEKLGIRKSDFKPVVRQSLKEVEELKRTEWDNKTAEELYKKENTINLSTLTLEDRLRAGAINEIDYLDTKEKSEIKFRK